MNSGKMLLGVLTGAALGAALGILFAPDKGATTRKKISKKGQEYAEELEEKFNDFIQSIVKKFETIKEEAGSAAENLPAGSQSGKIKTDNAIAGTAELK